MAATSTGLKVGDTVNVPGAMYGTLKYVGPVHGKRGMFAGVQLAPEYAARGKNSGDVEGKFYFRTSIPGSGIFLPAEKAEKRTSMPSGLPATPAQTALHTFNQGGRTSSAAGGLPKPNFSQSIGPGSLVPSTNTGLRAPSPNTRISMRRDSLPRPSSPLRKTNAVARATTPTAGRLATPKTRPSLGLSKSTIGAPGTGATGPTSPRLTTGPRSFAPNKFGQSLRQSIRGGTSPSKISRNGVASIGGIEPPLGPELAFDEEDESHLQSPDGVTETTPTPAAGRNFKGGPVVESEEVRRLKESVLARDAQLNEQAASIAEMERSLAELQDIVATGGVPQSQPAQIDDEELPKDVQTLRAALREKNERIKALTAEFDANRADFRSTIDTLEMASTETERVYEKRVDELLEELRGYQERNEDVEGFAMQFKQLEDVVQELEEGLEDARRGEAEARGEVEFLRGEVERGRSEIRKERERSRAGDKLNGIDSEGGHMSAEELDELQTKLDQKSDEIRGLKAIISSLNDAQAKWSPDMNRTPRPNGGSYGHGHSKTKSTNTVVSVGLDDTSEHLQQQIRDIENLLETGNYNAAELKEEVHKLRQSVQFGVNGAKVNIPGLGINSAQKSNNGESQKHRSVATSSSASTARPGSMKSNRSSNSSKPYSLGHRRKDTGVPEFVDAKQSPVKEEFEEMEFDPSLHHNLGSNNKPGKGPGDTASISGMTDASSNAALWCEICEEAGHDILTCSNMGFDSDKIQATIQSPSRLRPGTVGSTGGIAAAAAVGRLGLSGKDVVREGLRRSRDSPHPPPSTNVPPPPPLQGIADQREYDIDRPAPLSMGSRQGSFTSSNGPKLTPTSPSMSIPATMGNTTSLNGYSNETSKPRQSSFSHPAPIEHPISSSSLSSRNQTKKPSQDDNGSKLIEGTGAQTGMLAGKESRTIDPDKWCALCERDGHDSVDCPIEDAF